jgi:hypothetical protein
MTYLVQFLCSGFFFFLGGGQFLFFLSNNFLPLVQIRFLNYFWVRGGIFQFSYIPELKKKEKRRRSGSLFPFFPYL